jgi:hypothetical protein
MVFRRVAVGIVVAWAVACGGSLPHPPYIQQPPTALVTVLVEPPPARFEYVPARPDVKGAVWIDGEWSLRRGRWAWTVGRWLVVPAGVKYSPWAFVRAADGTLRFAPGAFWDAAGKSVAAPVALAEAKAGTVAVVDPDGFTETTGRTRRFAVTSGAPDASAPVTTDAGGGSVDGEAVR